MTLSGQVRTTMLRGRIVFDDGRIVAGASGRMIGTRS
jgi:dihydroorotase-like cyclic amidohydrolase